MRWEFAICRIGGALSMSMTYMVDWHPVQQSGYMANSTEQPHRSNGQIVVLEFDIHLQPFSIQYTESLGLDIIRHLHVRPSQINLSSQL